MQIAASQPFVSLPPPRAFAEASASVEAALEDLRNAERALERQLSDLRRYMRVNQVAGEATPASPHPH